MGNLPLFIVVGRAHSPGMDTASGATLKSRGRGPGAHPSNGARAKFQMNKPHYRFFGRFDRIANRRRSTCAQPYRGRRVGSCAHARRVRARDSPSCPPLPCQTNRRSKAFDAPSGDSPRR